MSIYKSLILTSMDNIEKNLNKIPNLYKPNFNNEKNPHIKNGNLRTKNNFLSNQKHYFTYNNLGNNYGKIFDITLEFNKIKNNIDKLNEQLKEKDDLILTLKKKIHSMSSRNNDNINNKLFQKKDNNSSLNELNEDENLTIYDNNIDEELKKIKQLNSIRNKFSYSFNSTNNLNNKLLLNEKEDKFKNSFITNSTKHYSSIFKHSESIKSKLSNDNIFSHRKPFTLTYFRYQQEMMNNQKKNNKYNYNLIRINLFKNLKKQDNKTILNTTNNKNNNNKTTINNKQLNSIANKKVSFQKNFCGRKKKEDKSRNKDNKNAINIKSKSKSPFNTSSVKTRETNNKSQKNLYKAKNIKKINEKKNNNHTQKRLIKGRMTYKKLEEIKKIIHNKNNLNIINNNKKQLKDNYKNKLNLEKFIKKKKKKKKIEEYNENSLEATNPIKIIDNLKERNKIQEDEFLYQSIEEKNLLEIKSKLQKEFNHFNNYDNEENNINNNQINNYDSFYFKESLSERNLSQSDLNNSLKEQKKVKNKSSHSSINSLELFDKQKEIYILNKPSDLIQNSHSKKFLFEKSLSDIQIDDVNKYEN